MLAMIAAVAIENVERVDTLEMMLPEPGGEDAGHPGVEARAEQRHQPRFLEAVLIRPLPLIFALRLVARLVIRGLEIIRPGRPALRLYRQVLICQRAVDALRLAYRSSDGRFRFCLAVISLVRFSSSSPF